MSRCRLALALVASLPLAVTAFSETTPESCLARLNADVDALLQKDQPKLFAWHLQSLKALAQSEFASLLPRLDKSPNRQMSREKEFVQYVGGIAEGLEKYCSDPDLYLKEGLRSLVLARSSNIDGTLQYMTVDLPKGWDPDRAYPLFVGLHGSGPDNPLAYPFFGFGPPSPPKADAPPNPTADMIRIGPWGRGNRGWRGDAEEDLWEAIRLLKTFCKLDPERWYITGHSSGADGCWAIVQHTPDLWAAAGIQSGSMLSGEPEWGLIPNQIHVPTHILIGANDPLPFRLPDSKRAYQILKEAGDQTELVILPGIGHYPLTEAGINEQAAWMTRFVRTRPDKFSFTVDQPQHPGVWGIHVPYSWETGPIRAPWPSFTCEIHGQDVRISTRNIQKLTIDLGPDGLRLSGSVRVWVNRRMVLDGPVPLAPLDIKKI